MEKIGFIGLGHMGQPMARNLIHSGYEVMAYDIVPEAMHAFETQGGKSAPSLIELVQNNDIIMTMLQTGQQVKQTCLENGIFDYAKKNSLVVDFSSIDIKATEEIHSLAKTIGITFLDAPVSGGVLGAEKATLTIMVGGDESSFLRAKPILEKLGKKIIHAGAGGQGQAAKICNNLILGISMIAVSEGFTLASKLGMDLKKFYEIASNSSAQCWSMTQYCPVPGILENSPASNQYQPGFMAKMMLKDLMLAMQAAEGSHAAVPLGSVATELYSLFVDQGKGEMDFSGIIKMIAEVSF